MATGVGIVEHPYAPGILMKMPLYTSYFKATEDSKRDGWLEKLVG